MRTPARVNDGIYNFAKRRERLQTVSTPMPPRSIAQVLGSGTAMVVSVRLSAP